ncbi:MAG: hypothetical protein NUW37_20170 [Planctomycetes bacterium]|nr:hypothetical protein [Planctomycetota bacterium]
MARNILPIVLGLAIVSMFAYHQFMEPVGYVDDPENYSDVIAEAAKHVGAGEIQLAIDALEGAYRRGLGTKELHLQLAELYLKLKNGNRARKHFLEAMLKGENPPETFVKISALFSEANDFTQARTFAHHAIDRATELKESCYSGWVALGSADFYDGELALSRFTMPETEGVDTSQLDQTILDVKAWAQNKFTEAYDSFHKAREIDDTAEIELWLSRISMRRSQSEELTLSLQEVACDKDPGFFQAHLEAGSYRCELGMFDEAEPYLARALEIRPDDFSALYYFGIYYTELGYRYKHEAAGREAEARGMFLKAADFFKRASIHDGNSPELIRYVGRLALYQDDLLAANQALQALIAMKKYRQANQLRRDIAIYNSERGTRNQTPSEGAFSTGGN